MKKVISVLLVLGLLMIPVAVAAAELKPLRITQTWPAVGKVQDWIDQMDKKKDLSQSDADQLKAAKFLEKEMNKIGYYTVNEDWGWAEPLEQKQLAALLISEGPDVFHGEVQMPALAQQGAFVDLTNEPWIKDITPGATAGMTFDGKIYGVTGTATISWLDWNKKLFAKTGLDPNKPPKTWDEWLEMANKITVAGKGEFFGGGIYAGENNVGGPLRTCVLLRQLGGDYADAKGNPTIDTPEFKQHLEFIKALNKNTPGGVAASPNYMLLRRLSQADQIAFTVSEATFPELGYGEIPLPWGGAPANVLIANEIFAVPKYSKNQAAAIKYLELRTSPQFVELELPFWYHAMGINKKATTKLNADPFLAKLQTMILALMPGGNVKGLVSFPRENAKIYRLIGEAYGRAQLTEEPIPAILKDVQAKIDDVLK